MGAESSTLEKKKREEEQNKKMIQDVLEKQRKLYEKKCIEMLQQQSVYVAKEVVEGRSLQTVTEKTPNATKNYAPLYPTLQDARNINVQPSTSSATYVTKTTNNLQMNMKAEASSTSYNNTTFNSYTRTAPAASTSKSSSALSPSCPPSAPAAVTSRAAPEQKASPTTRYGNIKKEELCSTCGGCLSVKIYHCSKGHSCCLVCKFKKSNCGVCSSPITDIRNITLETYLAELKSTTPEKAVNCPNKSDGCRLLLKPSNLEAHLKDCLFREMACPVALLNNKKCVWRGKINQIQAHFLDCHPNQTGADVDTEMNFNPLIQGHIVNYIILGTFNFLVHLKTDTKFVYCTVQLIGPRMSASKWTYEFHIYNKGEPRRKYFYSDICTSNSDDFTDICKELNCSVLPLPYANSYVNDNKLTYKFYIKKSTDNEVKRNQGPNQWVRGRRPNNKNVNT